MLRTGPGRKTKEKFVKIEEGEKIASSDDDLGEKALKTMMLNRWGELLVTISKY